MKLINIFKPVSLFVLVLAFSSCDALLDENLVNKKYTDKTIWGNSVLAEGVLLKAYGLMPSDYNLNSSYIVDDAVTNETTSNLVSMATGGYTSRLTPLSTYSNTYLAFLHINTFLENVDSVQWAWRNDNISTNPPKPAIPVQIIDSAHIRNAMIIKKLKGEAYGLRAWYGARLLQETGGMGANNVLLGYPIVTRSITDSEEGKLPRNTYAECVEQIFADCDMAIANLPLKWSDAGLSATQKEIIGVKNLNRISGIGAMAIKARVALTAASPAFAAGSDVTMAQAAQLAANLMKANNGITGLNAKDVEFYKQGNVTPAELGSYREALWYTSIAPNASGREANFFPPSLFGKGKVNPSQNLVDAFGFSNGYPFDTLSVYYNPVTPYAARDPRLEKYIAYNGSTYSSVALNTITGTDAIGASATATRTGYYLRKLLDQTVSLKPNAVVGKAHSVLHLRYTEVLLNFAEAANEVGGPDFAIEGFTARGVINAIRTRAGITGPINTIYMASLDKAGLAALIKNERRIELCFEGFRFYDLCRWNDITKLNETVKAINPATLVAFGVEKRVYQPYMIYPPFPYNETLVYDIVQNKGW